MRKEFVARLHQITGWVGKRRGREKANTLGEIPPKQKNGAISNKKKQGR